MIAPLEAASEDTNAEDVDATASESQPTKSWRINLFGGDELKMILELWRPAKTSNTKQHNF